MYDVWGDTDRSHHNPARRRPRADVVRIAPPTPQRVLLANGLVLEGNSSGERESRMEHPRTHEETQA